MEEKKGRQQSWSERDIFVKKSRQLRRREKKTAHAWYIYHKLRLSSPPPSPLSPTALHKKQLAKQQAQHNKQRLPISEARLHLVGDSLALLDGVDRQRALLAVQLVGKLRVVLDVRDADLGVVAVEDAGDFLEGGAPVRRILLVNCSRGNVGDR